MNPARSTPDAGLPWSPAAAIAAISTRAPITAAKSRYTILCGKNLSLHVEIAGKVNKIIRELGLRELGQLEQDLVFGDAGMKDVIKFLTTKEDTTGENKLRLMMILAAIYPEKFEGDKGQNLNKLDKLPPDDMKAMSNMQLLEIGESFDRKKSALKFDHLHKKKRAARKERPNDRQETWQLSRFYPIIEELIENLSKGELSKEDYPCLNPTFHQPPVAHSRRTPTWAPPWNSDDGYSSHSVLRQASSDFKKMGQRILICSNSRWSY
ncbi:hypothetical protein M0R45_031859 [Rubus argutus]|uniref:Uncharacterized protein n=1 Tax=Rubus argutus TaxID=59490 RepID=A0AAW1WHG7_RUBAR